MKRDISVKEGRVGCICNIYVVVCMYVYSVIVYLIMYCIVMALCAFLYIEYGHRHSDVMYVCVYISVPLYHVHSVSESVSWTVVIINV